MAVAIRTAVTCHGGQAGDRRPVIVRQPQPDRRFKDGCLPPIKKAIGIGNKAVRDNSDRRSADQRAVRKGRGSPDRYVGATVGHGLSPLRIRRQFTINCPRCQVSTGTGDVKRRV